MGKTTAISGKRQEMDSELVCPTPRSFSRDLLIREPYQAVGSSTGGSFSIFILYFPLVM